MDGPNESKHPKDIKAVAQESIKKIKEKSGFGAKICLAITAFVYVALLVIGCLNVHKCPVDKNIPLFLIATGAIGLLSKFITLIRNIVSPFLQLIYLETALYIVEMIFFILGTCWVFIQFPPSYDPKDGTKYCDQVAFLTAFIYIVVWYAILILLLSGFCCFLCCAVCLATVMDINDMEAQNRHRQSPRS